MQSRLTYRGQVGISVQRILRHRGYAYLQHKQTETITGDASSLTRVSICDCPTGGRTGAPITSRFMNTQASSGLVERHTTQEQKNDGEIEKRHDECQNAVR
jgi:hypothetical protein